MLSLAGALALTRVAVVLLRPREGLIEPDPVDTRDYFSTDDIVRARRYARPQLALHAGTVLIRGALLVALIGREPRLRRSRPPLLDGLLCGSGLSVALTLAPLPLRALARRRALRVGLATQSWRGWARDLAKSTAIEAGFAGASALAVRWLERRYPRGWWLAGAAGSVAGQVVFTLLAPVLIDPIFNRFEVLGNGPVRTDVLELARRAGVNVGEVYQVDASTRTSAANAYVTGLGVTKRVVLFDTLLQSFTREQTRLVLAHELAHVRHRDVPRGLAQMALIAPVSMYATAALARELAPEEPAGEPARTLPALALSLGIVSALVGPVSSALSRRVEARADAFALQLTDAPESFIAFEQQIVRQNLADPAPPRWLCLMGTHPPTVKRIGIALAYRRQTLGAKVGGYSSEGS